MKTIKETILASLQNSQGDDLYRAKLAFKNYSKNNMLKQWGQSGKTCQQVLDEYQQRYDEIQEAIDYVKAYF